MFLQKLNSRKKAFWTNLDQFSGYPGGEMFLTREYQSEDEEDEEDDCFVRRSFSYRRGGVNNTLSGMNIDLHFFYSLSGSLTLWTASVKEAGPTLLQLAKSFLLNVSYHLAKWPHSLLGL